MWKLQAALLGLAAGVVAVVGFIAYCIHYL
jgi:hypothetical protein